MQQQAQQRRSKSQLFCCCHTHNLEKLVAKRRFPIVRSRKCHYHLMTRGTCVVEQLTNRNSISLFTLAPEVVSGTFA